VKKLFALLLLCSALAFPQGTTSTLDGTVTDPQGAAVPEAQILVVNIATGKSFRTTANAAANG
jgi:hypothetical protein